MEDTELIDCDVIIAWGPYHQSSIGAGVITTTKIQVLQVLAVLRQFNKPSFRNAHAATKVQLLQQRAAIGKSD